MHGSEEIQRVRANKETFDDYKTKQCPRERAYNVGIQSIIKEEIVEDYEPENSPRKLSVNVDIERTTIKEETEDYECDDGQSNMTKETFTTEEQALSINTPCIKFENILVNSNHEKYNCEFCEYKTTSLRVMTKHLRKHRGSKDFYRNDTMKFDNENCTVVSDEFQCMCSDGDCSCKTNLPIITNIRSLALNETQGHQMCDYNTVKNLTTKNQTIPSNKLSDQSSLISPKGLRVRHKYTKPNLNTYPKSQRVKQFLCEVCGYKTALKSLLITHERIHTGEKPFACNHCDYRTNDKPNLTRHLLQHTSEKPFACDYCNYKGKHKQLLINHIRKHTGEKPYGCSSCNYRCSDKSSLNRHNKRHTGVKPFACDLCVYKANRNYHLIIHLKKHTRERTCI